MGEDKQQQDRPDASFKVSDRRRFNPDGTPREEAEGQATPESPGRDEPGPPQPDQAACAEPEAERTPETAQAAADQPRVTDFSGFILSLAQAAMIELGVAPDPTSGEICRDLKLARQTIDILGMLQTKTKGNLTDEETRLLEGTLYQLRLAFVECCKQRKAE